MMKLNIPFQQSAFISHQNSSSFPTLHIQSFFFKLFLIHKMQLIPSETTFLSCSTEKLEYFCDWNVCVQYTRCIIVVQVYSVRGLRIELGYLAGPSVSVQEEGTNKKRIFSRYRHSPARALGTFLSLLTSSRGITWQVPTYPSTGLSIYPGYNSSGWGGSRTIISRV